MYDYPPFSTAPPEHLSTGGTAHKKKKKKGLDGDRRFYACEHEREPHARAPSTLVCMQTVV